MSGCERFISRSFPIDKGQEHVAQYFSESQRGGVNCLGSGFVENFRITQDFGGARLEIVWAPDSRQTCYANLLPCSTGFGYCPDLQMRQLELRMGFS